MGIIGRGKRKGKGYVLHISYYVLLDLVHLVEKDTQYAIRN